MTLVARFPLHAVVLLRRLLPALYTEAPRITIRVQPLAEGFQQIIERGEADVLILPAEFDRQPVTGRRHCHTTPSRRGHHHHLIAHQIVIHRWGWTLVLNPDGTTTAWNPDKTKVLRSHSPPARPG